MTYSKEKLEAILAELKQHRDELKLKLHLGKAEAADEWEKLERKYQELKARAGVVLDAAGASAGEVGSALELVVEELKNGYRRIRKRL